ncbi:shufflon system plasmid conjugative transfer pilus tip adhesin PilV [Enterobacter ludwigii]|uniref:shufflon system plasmid conjugative transfer pilus tip adhesin PilV n=1 Tax=Enterobacter ludwigii TaxID=299767 RepID=UPI00242C8C20|nr:shufflon system plasmid conjugative transfer pilus tip adhesin PilV [Enterobacter ludwigii]WGC20688.1 shufflon system plasmid conjugative transfer pilus tip adhesin PilV [Enterobacter ludwigii]
MTVETVIPAPRKDRGWAIASTGAALVILITVVIWGVQRWDEYFARQDWQVSARQVTRFTQAVRAYTGKYYDTLLSSATTTKPVIVTAAMLKNTGFLESGFSETISSGQQLRAALVRNATNTDQLQGLIVSQGGTSLPYMGVRDISVSISSGLGAYIWGNNTTVTGANQSWTLPLSAFGITSTTGHIATLLTTDALNEARQDSDRLYRFAVTGKPDLNRMHTSIDMGNNNINNAAGVNGQTGNFSGNITAGGNISAGGNVAATGNVTANGGVTANNDIRSNNGWLITKGSKGWLNETYQGGFYMSDNDWVRVANNKNIYTSGQIRGGTLQTDGRLTVGEYSLHVKVESAGTSCPQDGLQARDATGGPLYCQSGVWSTTGFSGKYTNLGSYISSTTGKNLAGTTMFLFVSGGQSTVNKGVSDGDNCTNTFDLKGYVSGTQVAGQASANSNWNKSGFITFAVPPGSEWRLESSPLPSYGCSPGRFSVYSYQ